MKKLLQEWKQRREEERQIAEEVKDIHSDKEFQERYGLTDEQMAAFQLAWKQVFLPAEILILIVKVAAIVIPLVFLQLWLSKVIGLS